MDAPNFTMDAAHSLIFAASLVNNVAIFSPSRHQRGETGGNELSRRRRGNQGPGAPPPCGSRGCDPGVWCLSLMWIHGRQRGAVQEVPPLCGSRGGGAPGHRGALTRIQGKYRGTAQVRPLQHRSSGDPRVRHRRCVPPPSLWIQGWGREVISLADPGVIQGYGTPPCLWFQDTEG